MENVLDAKSVKKEFLRRFSCSETMLTVLDRAAGLDWKELEEASDPLCGGIVAELDAACGALWGAGLAAGVRARSRIGDRAAASEAALEATRNAVSAWQRTGRQLNCGDILGMRKWSLVQFMLKGNLRVCQGQLCDMAPVFHDIIEKTMSERGQFTAGARRRNCAAEAFDRVSEAIGLKTDGLDVVVAGLAQADWDCLETHVGLWLP